MANASYYVDRDHGICWAPETAFRTTAQGLNTANAAGDTFYRLPIQVVNVPLWYIKRGRYYERLAGDKYWGDIGFDGYEEGKITLSGNMLDCSMLYYLTKACTTTDNSPSGGLYTHVYATTTAQAATPPTFSLLIKFVNAESGNNIFVLLLGCHLTALAITGSKDNKKIQGSLSIEFASAIAGADLTTWPTFGTINPYLWGRTKIDYKKGATAYPGSILGFEIIYDDGSMLNTIVDNETANEVLNGNPDIRVGLNFVPKDETHFEDTTKAPLAPATASDINITIKMYRSKPEASSTDYTQFAFEKLWNIEDAGDWGFALRRLTALNHATKFIIKPAGYETGAKLTITEVNALTDDRYET